MVGAGMRRMMGETWKEGKTQKERQGHKDERAQRDSSSVSKRRETWRDRPWEPAAEWMPGMVPDQVQWVQQGYDWWPCLPTAFMATDPTHWLRSSC